MQPVCADHEYLYALKLTEQYAKKRKAEERKNYRERKEKLKTRAQWIADAQRAFNQFIRTRDLAAGYGCIDCGKPFEPNKPGGSVDAGHFLSRGSAPHLRFDERNCFAQRKNCNMPGGATREAFRAGVEARIGVEELKALEADQSSPKWTIDDLKEIIATYREKTRKLAKD